MIAENEKDNQNKNQPELGKVNKNTKNNEKEKIKKKKNINKNENKVEEEGFDLNTFCPDPDAREKKTRSRTVRESVKKGKLKKLLEEEKSNKIDPRKYLKTPQVMVPKLRPQKSSLNPTPLKLNPFSLKSSKLNIINEENIILSEREEESENSESSSSSSSFFSEEEENIENINEEEIEYEEEKEEIEEKEEEEKEEEKEEIKEKDENIEIKKDEIKSDNKPNIGILGCLIKNKNENGIKKNIKVECEDEGLYENRIIENKKEENDQLSLKEIRKNMKEEKKSFKKKNKDMFSIIDNNIKNNYKKFKEDVLDEEKIEEEIKINNNDINDKNRHNCCPILDFYAKNSKLLKSKN